MSVVERCPNCGTTQAMAGDCQACHEAQVRYFCTNHERGVWLSGPTCPQCEARLAPPARPPALPAHMPRVRRERAAPEMIERERPRPSAVVARPSPPPMELIEREPVSLDRAGGWLKRLVLRLALIAVILVVLVIAAVYMLARSLY